MLEFLSIKKKKNKKQLTVEVICKERKYIAEPIKLLTTAELISIILEEENYKISSIKKEPRHKVGNSNRKNVKTSGTWFFEIVENKETNAIDEIKIEKKPENIKPVRKRTTKKSNSTQKPKQNIRGRISKLARNSTNKED
tara:strand:- start:4733 stop:5152 length:420 start_codon:yes stop_codon:yes gene_type:complete